VCNATTLTKNKTCHLHSKKHLHNVELANNSTKVKEEFISTVKKQNKLRLKTIAQLKNKSTESAQKETKKKLTEIIKPIEAWG
jgi:restriction endonuclease